MRNVKFFAASVAVIAILAGCLSLPGQPAPSDIPSWYLDPPTADDAIYGVGSAQLSRLDMSRRTALSRARQDIAFQMNSTIEAALIDYFQEAGADDSDQVLSFVENIARDVTQFTLEGVQNEAVEVGSDGTVYALVSYPTTEFSEAAAEVFNRNEGAQFADFKADEAQRSLDDRLGNNPPTAGQSETE